MAVVFGIGAVGFTLVTTVMVTLGLSWLWGVALVGLAVGTALALVAIAGDLPMVLLALLSGLGGLTSRWSAAGHPVVIAQVLGLQIASVVTGFASRSWRGA